MNEGLKDDPIIFVDDSIPGGFVAFDGIGLVRTFDGHEACRSPEVVKEANVLVTRSITRIDDRLLSGAPFLTAVASPTIGTDHVDVNALEDFRRQNGRSVPFFNAPGATSGGVADFALAAILEGFKMTGVDPDSARIGIWGFGNCGSALATRLDSFGIDWVAHDPPLHERTEFESAPVTEVLECDAVSLHVPLTERDQSDWPTRHMIGPGLLNRMTEGRTGLLINTSRGAVIDSRALARSISGGSGLSVCLDVWEGEPSPDPGLLDRVDIATPHIAGSVIEGRERALLMVRDSIMWHLGVHPGSTGDDNFAMLRPRGPFCRSVDDLRTSIGIRQLSDSFKRMYMNARKEEKGGVFSRFRATAVRHELKWE